MSPLADSQVTYVPVTCTVEEIADLTPAEKLFRIRLPGGRPLGHQPGQFVQVSLLGMEEAPISISNSPTRGNDTFELAIRKVGLVTSALHALQPGATVGIRGPFGTPFPVEDLRGKDLLFISGGCGLAPMRSVIQYCEDHRTDYGRMTIIYGARSPQDMMFKEEVRAWESSDVIDCQHTVDTSPPTPDGSCYSGKVGLITTLIPPLKLDSSKTVAMVVGPPIMYKFVIRELLEKRISESQIIVSLERYMRCGVGKCGHCVIEHKYCCIDGPVFWYSEIKKLQGAL